MLRVEVLVAIVLVMIESPSATYAHRLGCHRWHSCPSDTISYESRCVSWHSLDEECSRPMTASCALRYCVLPPARRSDEGPEVGAVVPGPHQESIRRVP